MTAPPRRRPRVPVWALVLVALVVVGIPVTALVLVSRSEGPQRVEYVVPAGTAARQASGERIDILPAELRLKVGDHLVIRNEDDADQSVGIFTVRAHETLDQPFPTAREYKGACSLHGSGEIRIIVE